MTTDQEQGTQIDVDEELMKVDAETMIKVAGGDLAGLNNRQRLAIYARTCQVIGVEFLTHPFDFLRVPQKGTDPDKIVLYANRTCTDQLRTNRAVSLEVVETEEVAGILKVRVKATDPSGRFDEATAAVALEKEIVKWVPKDNGQGNIPKGTGQFERLSGDDLCNAIMRAETKAKRRATLSFCGLGWMDESEVSTVRGAKRLAGDFLETGDSTTTEAEVLDEQPEREATQEGSSGSSNSSAGERNGGAQGSQNGSRGQRGQSPPDTGEAIPLFLQALILSVCEGRKISRAQLEYVMKKKYGVEKVDGLTKAQGEELKVNLQTCDVSQLPEGSPEETPPPANGRTPTEEEKMLTDGAPPNAGVPVEEPRTSIDDISSAGASREPGEDIEEDDAPESPDSEEEDLTPDLEVVRLRAVDAAHEQNWKVADVQKILELLGISETRLGDCNLAQLLAFNKAVDGGMTPDGPVGDSAS